MNIFLWILLTPVLFIFSPLSPFTILISTQNLFYDCNEKTTAKIISITNTDTFQCNMDIYIYNYNKNITIPNLECSTLVKCRKRKFIKHNDPNECVNITIALNHLYPDRCIKLILSEYDGIYISSTFDFYYNFFIASLISFSFFCFVVIFIHIEHYNHDQQRPIIN